MEKKNSEVILTINRTQEVEKSNKIVNILLFLATIGTTFGVAGYWFIYKDTLLAALFSGSLLAILGIHELGHKIFAEENGVEASWPYFLPIPIPLVGTLGAIIKNKTPIPTKEALVEIGASGPLLGFAAAAPIAVMGLLLSDPAGGSMFKVPFSPFTELPTPLLYYLMGESIFGSFPSAVDLHPLAWAGFLGIYITWLNLLPTGQLDGGHVARALLKEGTHQKLTKGIIILFVALGLVWIGFIFIAVLIMLVARGSHPGALESGTKLGQNHLIIASITFGVFILCFPIPV